MKSRLKLLLVLLIGVVLFYMGCKKDSTQNQTKQQTISADMISSQVASNLSKSLSGFYGGVKISDGIKTPSIITNANAAPNPICGFTVDSVLNYNTTASDTVSHTNGRIIFIFNCTNGQPSGYSATDSLNNTGTATGFSFINNIVQNYAITSLNPSNTLLSVNGSLVSFVGITYTAAGIKPTSDSTSYVLTGLTVDLSKQDDITGGSATFVTTGSTNYGPWNYTGTIKYLGNHMADITINGKVYHVTI